MDDIIRVPLNLPDVRILCTRRTEQGPWLIRVESTREGTQCRRCGREIRDLHGVDAVVRLDDERKRLVQETQVLQQRQNEVSKAIPQEKDPEKKKALIEEGRNLRAQVAAL